jgi:nitroreductase
VDLLEAIDARKSIRAFKPEPVSKDVLMEILEIATRAPSSVNSQPWEFFIAQGEALKALKRASLEEYRLGKPPVPELGMGPLKGVAPTLEGVFKERQVALAKQIFKLVGIQKGDKTGIEKWNESMVQFYEAPTIIVIVIDKMLQSKWPIVDVGLVVGYIALAAQNYGLGTCIMRAIVDHPEQVRKIVGIPDSKFIMIGIAIGYPDWDHPINELRTNREKLENIVTFVE